MIHKHILSGQCCKPGNWSMVHNSNVLTTMNALWWNLDQNTNLLLGLLIMPQGQIGTAIVPNAPMYISCLILKAYASEEILNWHCLSLSPNADLCIHFYWLSQLRQVSHRKTIQGSALILTKTMTKPVQNIFRYSSFETTRNIMQRSLLEFAVYLLE